MQLIILLQANGNRSAKWNYLLDLFLNCNCVCVAVCIELECECASASRHSTHHMSVAASKLLFVCVWVHVSVCFFFEWWPQFVKFGMCIWKINIWSKRCQKNEPHFKMCATKIGTAKSKKKARCSRRMNKTNTETTHRCTNIVRSLAIYGISCSGRSKQSVDRIYSCEVPLSQKKESTSKKKLK